MRLLALMTMPSMTALLVAVALLATGCGDYPIEPGSDLPAESPPAVLSDQPPAAPAPPVPTPDGAPELDEDALLDGQFAVTGTLASPLGDTITAAFTAQVAQSAPLGDPAATIDLALLDEEDPSAAPPRFDAPAPLSAEGAFNGTVVDFEESLMGRGFKFTNPNASKSCGCGESFSV